MYRIAEAKGVENLIAGAWGSRNFRIFLEVLEKIIARRDLNMSPGKLAAQVSHAFLLEKLYWGSKVV